MKKAFVLAVLAAASFIVVTDAQQAGHNTPVLPGQPADPNDPQAHLKSDLLQQGQVENSGVVSTRDWSNIIWAFNDYRAVDISESSTPGGSEISQHRPGALQRFFAWVMGRPAKQAPAPRVRAAGEASVGLAFSYDAGYTFTGGLLQPIENLAAMTDPRGAGAPCGKAYFVLLAFTRDGKSVIAVVTYEDLALPTGDSWKNVRYSIVDEGNNSPGIFHDKPWIIVDPLRPRSGRVSDPCAHNIYIGWARFNGEGQAVKLNFAKSTDGVNWTKKYIASPAKTVQGVVIDVDKRPGRPNDGGGGMVYYGFRSFMTPTSNNPPTMYIARSKDFGETFEKAVAVNTSPIFPFDEPSIGTDFDSSGVQLAFRTNAFLSIQSVPISANKSRLFAAWAERRTGCGAASQAGDPKIVYTWSDTDGATWAPRQLLDCLNRDTGNLPKAGLGFLPQPRGPGGQFQVHLTSGGGRFGALYHESRNILTDVGGLPFITRGPTGRNQIDARFALINPGNPGPPSTPPSLLGTNQVSRYPVMFGADLNPEPTEPHGEGPGDIVEVAPGVRAISDRNTEPTRVLGTTPFFGDYPEAIPVVSQIPVRDGNGNVTSWRWAIASTDVPFQGFRVGFSDSRNQIPPANLTDYPNYSPPSCPSCDPPIIYPNPAPACNTAGSRNLDIVHALVDASVAVNAGSTFESTSLIARNFPVTITNGTGGMQFYKGFFTELTGMGTTASFSQDVPFPEIEVELFPYSSTTRTVTLRGPANASVRVNFAELQLSVCADAQHPRLETCEVHSVLQGGQTGSAVLNLDPTTPLQASDDELHTPGTKGPGTKGIALNPGTKGPGTKGSALNPGTKGPGTKGSSIANMLIQNAALDSALDSGKQVHKIIDVTWEVTNGGTDAATLFSQFNVEKPAVLDQNYIFHLLISRQSAFASLDPTTCQTENNFLDQVISSIPMSPLQNNPLINNPGTKGDALAPGTKGGVITNATFAVAPSETQGTSSARATAAAVAVDPSIALVSPPGWGDTRDTYKDVVFVTLRAFQLAPDSEIPDAAEFHPEVSPPGLTVTSTIKDTVDGTVQDDVNSAGNSFVVTTTADTTADDGLVSLREAMLAADENAGFDAITFNIPGPGPYTINLSSALPTVSEPVIIDGTTQPGFAGTPVIALNGSGAGTAHGLHISAGDSIVRGLRISGFGGNGILLDTDGSNVIEGNYIGTDGVADLGNAGNGVHAIDSANNTIGGTTIAARNVISGNGGEGVRIDGALSTGNVIRGNYIGTSASGSAAIGNSLSGVFIRRAPGNSVIDNVASGNLGFAGIAICGDLTTVNCGGGDFGTQGNNAAGTVVQGNLVGTDAAGVAPLGNQGIGVSVHGTPDTLVGGDSAALANVIAFNGLRYTGGAPDFSPGVVVFGAGAIRNQILRNSIHTNGRLGIDLGTATGSDDLTSNDNGDGLTPPPDDDAGPNGLQNFPVLTSVVNAGGVTTVTGTLKTTPGTANIIIELFNSPVCDPSGNGEGQTWLQSIAGLATDTSGDLTTGTFTAIISPALPEGTLVTATATTSADGTSEFSGCRMVVPPGFADWPISEGGNGHVYEYVTTPGTWTAAEAAARARSFRGVAGHLATILSFSENAVVNSLRGTGDMRGWIGLTDAVVEGVFQWITGELVGFSSWAPGEPNAETPFEDFVEMFATGQWNDTGVGEALNQGYLVEYPVTPSALVDSPLPPVADAEDFIDRGFYLPSYPGRMLSRVRLWLSASAAATYTISLTARADTYDGLMIGAASQTLSLPANVNARTQVDFDFLPAPVTPGTRVTFTMTQVSPAGLTVYYDVGACDFSPSCATPSPYKETEGTTPPLDTFRRNGVSVLLFDTTPQLPPILF